MPTTLCGFNDGINGTGQHLLAFRGPTIIVNIGFDPHYPAANGIPDLAAKDIHALVDTGASESCIDSGLAMHLNLPIVDQRRISGSGGAHDVNMHLAHIHIPGLATTISGAFAAVNLAAGGQSHLALIGRTFLMYFRMHYDGMTGTVSISNDPLPMNAKATA
ncbi:aspartyl protease family protein [Mesorhizobium sp. M0053]|uniref:aspartyl protease family protein n=1 Tax=Mesorhizobium sp. M0053 TaxID=2956864 RepID=UPI003336840D